MTATPVADFAPLIVDTNIGPTQYHDKLTVMSNGNIVVSSTEWDSNEGFRFRIVDATTNAITNVDFDPAPGESDSASAIPLAVTAAGDGFLAAWSGFINAVTVIRGQYFDADGVAQGGIVTLASENSPGVNDDPGKWGYYPRINLYDLAVQGDGSIVVSFTLASEEDVFDQAHEYDTKGVVVSVGGGGISDISSVFDIENTWNSSTTLRLRPLPEGGFFAAGPEQVLDSAPPSTALHTEYAIRTFDSAGVQQQRIVTDVPIWQYQDNVVAMGGGRFAILSNEILNGPGGHTLSLNIIDETGQRIVEPVRLEKNLWLGDDYYAKLVYLADGSFAAVWSPDSLAREAFVLQRFAADGTLLGDEVVITDGNPDTDTSYHPEVAMDPLGRLVVSWVEYDPVLYNDGLSSDISYTQRFSFPDAFSGDIHNGTSGSDIQRGTVRHDLLAGMAGDDVQAGRGGKDRISGDAGDDVQRGGWGRDTLDGGDGNDRQYGGSGNDILRGGKGGDRMFGQAGNDKLKGEGGNDRMFGGDGDDTLHGAKGRDVLSGDSGADVFLYLKAAESGPNRQKRDIIRDFGQGSDVIDVSGIDAGPGGGDQAFTFIGTNGFSNSRGELRYTNLSGGNTLIAADIDGDGAADMQIELVGTFTLSDADFVL